MKTKEGQKQDAIFILNQITADDITVLVYQALGVKSKEIARLRGMTYNEARYRSHKLKKKKELMDKLEAIDEIILRAICG